MNGTQIKEQMKDEFRTQIKEYAQDIEDIKGNSGEWIDGYLPVYNNRIIEEWQQMPSDYDNRGAAELGSGGEIDIVNLMSLDLYLFYNDLFNEAIEELEEELEEGEE
jgi:hypothetical protein